VNPPPAQSFAPRVFAGPALRLQPDGRLVKLARDGSEAAFEEIVRRYAQPLQRYAGAIVTRQRAEDVTQDAFSKAFVALKGSDKEIKLRPWLYRIVRNTALNDLRDRPPQAAELDERQAGGEEPLDTLARRQQIEALMAGLAELPEPQRAAIVMRELEGLSHEQIAKSLGVTGGAVRQSIHRARTTLRNGAGMMVPLPLLRFLADGIGPDAASSSAAGGGGVGIGIAAKAGLATLLAAGTVTTGVVVNHDRQNADAAAVKHSASSGSSSSHDGAAHDLGDDSGPGGGRGSDNSGRGSSDGGSRHRGSGDGGASHSGPGDSGSGSGHSGSGSGDSSSSGTSGRDGSGSGDSSSGSGSSGSGSSGSGSSGSGSSGGGDDMLTVPSLPD
jgi:RNA polymerase sigma factor (sigma-70 family)